MLTKLNKLIGTNLHTVALRNQTTRLLQLPAPEAHVDMYTFTHARLRATKCEQNTDLTNQESASGPDSIQISANTP